MILRALETFSSRTAQKSLKAASWRFAGCFADKDATCTLTKTHASANKNAADVADFAVRVWELTQLTQLTR